MKKLIICSLTALTISSYAQATWNGSGTTGDANRTGRIGINTTSPNYALDVFSASGNGYDGISVTNGNSSGNCALFLKNSSISKEWQLWSLGAGNAWGAGNFCIYDGAAAQPQIFIENSSGNVGMGTHSPSAKLQVEKSTNTVGDQIAFQSNITQNFLGSNVQIGRYVGVEGNAITTTPFVTKLVGVSGKASDGVFSYGGEFEASAPCEYNSGTTYGIKATATGGDYAYGVWAEASCAATSGWAVYGVGDSYTSGIYWQSSDKRLKDNIKPLTNTLDKIKLLKPSTYTFKTSTFERMHLPKGNQIGLIAQDLEQIFPEMVKDVPEKKETDEKGNVEVLNPEFKAVQYTGLIPVLIAGMQEQQTQIESQQKQIDEQKQLINQLLQKAATPTSLDQNSLGAAGYAMEQNQPNPFNGVTTVKYTLPSTVVNAYMAVYDLAGKQIASFPITEKGSSSINITSEKLAAGIYIYSIVADNKVIDSKRMIVSEK